MPGGFAFTAFWMSAPGSSVVPFPGGVRRGDPEKTRKLRERLVPNCVVTVTVTDPTCFPVIVADEPVRRLPEPQLRTVAMVLSETFQTECCPIQCRLPSVSFWRKRTLSPTARLSSWGRIESGRTEWLTRARSMAAPCGGWVGGRWGVGRAGDECRERQEGRKSDGRGCAWPNSSCASIRRPDRHGTVSCAVASWLCVPGFRLVCLCRDAPQGSAIVASCFWTPSC